MPDETVPTGEAATFYLDELDTGAEHSRWGFHDPAASRLPRFLLWGCAILLVAGLLLGVALDGWAFLRKNYWAPLLWIGIAFLVYRFKFRERPYFRIAERELTFRSKTHRAERRIDWGDLERIDLEEHAVVLRRAGSGPVHLYFPNLSAPRTRALQNALTEAADAHGVAVT